MTIGKMALQLADIKTWRRDLAEANAAAMSPANFQAWIVSQLANNLAPLLESEINAISHEVGAIGEAVGELDLVVNEMIDHEDSYLQPELASNLVQTLLMGVELCQMITNFDPSDELANKKLGDLMKKYQQQAVAMVDEIEQIAAEEDEEDKDAGSGLHEESGHSQGTDDGGEVPAGGSGGPEPTGATPGDGGE